MCGGVAEIEPGPFSPEDGTGGPQPTDAAALLGALRPALPRLLFLSACLSAATPAQEADPRSALPSARDTKKSDDTPPATAAATPAHSLTSALIQAGLPAALGWDGSVADTAATAFAAELYRRLANREALALAVAEARRALLDAADEDIRGNWHLARLWLGSGGDGGAPLVAGARKRSLLPADYLHAEFRDKKDLLGKGVPVASHAMFVGRRRELQQALRILAAATHAGVLLTGMGRLGKSSLAARIANRRRDDLALAVLHGRFGIQDLVERLDEALQTYPPARDLVRLGQAQVRAALPQGEESALQALGDLHTDLLRGPCRQRDADGPTLLLILDDFELLLEEAAGTYRVQARHAGLIATVLRAFDPQATDSRLLLTSRFPFRLMDRGRDLAERLDRIELSSFHDTAERKLALRQMEAAQALGLGDLPAREAELARARAAARGNPGLLDLLIARLLLNPAVPLADAQAALAQMEGYGAGGELPQSEPLRELLESIAVDTLLALAGSAGKGLLQALTLFELAVPRAVAEQLAQEVGGNVQRLSDLALVEPGADPVRTTATAIRVSPLAVGRLPALSTQDRAAIASIVTEPLFAAWGGAAGQRPGAADLQLARLALEAEDAPVAAACGANAISALEANSYPAAAALGQDLLRLLEGAALAAPLPLLAVAARVSGAAGDGAAADALLAKGTAAFEAGQDVDPQDALALLDEHAKRLYRRGELDEALRIRTEEQLPVYERLGDVREKAVTTRKIADVLAARGKFREAARMIIDEALPPMAAMDATRDVLVFQAMAGMYLIQAGEAEGLTEASNLLCQALTDARRLRVPEAEQIAQILEQAGMDCAGWE